MIQNYKSKKSMHHTIRPPNDRKLVFEIENGLTDKVDAKLAAMVEVFGKENLDNMSPSELYNQYKRFNPRTVKKIAAAHWDYIYYNQTFI